MRRPRLAGAADVAPAALVAGLLVWLTVQEAGFRLTRWAPVAIIVVALLGVRLVVAPPAWRRLPRPVLAAAAALAAYAAWSCLSITWAPDKGIAWEGADRTLLYLALFALLALWPLRPGQGGLVVGGWTLAMIVFALVTLLAAAGDAHPLGRFDDDRLLGPGGYVNASAALPLMALWPAAQLAAARWTPWPLRALLAGGAVILCDVALLSQSRGSLIAVPVTAALVLLAGPGRVRVFFVLAAIAAGVAVGAGAVLDVGAAVRAGRAPVAELDAVVTRALLGAALTALLAGVAAFVDARGTVGAPAARRVHRVASALIAVGVVAAVVGALVVVGSPASAAHRAWHSFKGGYATTSTGTRLTSGLGSNRYDFYRVGLSVFGDHPLGGVGADNFKAQYLAGGRSSETPTYPHSLEIRTLVSTGLVGAALLLAFLAAWAAAIATRIRAGGPAAVVSAAAAGAFAYWVVHGSADWFWEFAGLGGAAFAMAGLACAVAADDPGPGGDPAPRPRIRAVPAAVAAVVTAAMLVALLPPWLAQRQVDAAGREFTASPGPAIARLRSAADLDRLDRRPLVIEGAAWLRLGDPGRARAAFAAALKRAPDDAYSTLQLGAIASARGDRRLAGRLLTRAVALSPRDPTAHAALTAVRSGRMIDLARLQAAILGAARQYEAK